MTAPESATPAMTTVVRREPRAGVVTLVLVGLNVLAFLAEFATGTDFNDTRSLYDHGALFGPAVLAGDWWRIVSGAFLHAGLWHITLNMLALYTIGRDVEFLVGHLRMALIYALALLGGGIAVVVFSPESVTVGASGAIFGLFGALLAFGLRMGPAGRALIGRLMPIVLVNLAITFAIPFISKAGHLGGFATGFVVGLVLYVRRPVVALAAAQIAAESNGTQDHDPANHAAEGRATPAEAAAPLAVEAEPPEAERPAV